MSIWTRDDLKKFEKSYWYRVPHYLWLAGLVVAVVGSAIAIFVLRNKAEGTDLGHIGLAMELTPAAPLLFSLYKGMQANKYFRRRLEIEHIVHRELLRILDPKELKRLEKRWAFSDALEKLK